MAILIEFEGLVVGEEDEGKKDHSAGRSWWNNVIPQNQWTGSGNEHEKMYGSAQILSHRRL